MIFNTSTVIMKKVKSIIYMKVNTYFIGAFLAMFLLLSCSSDDNIPSSKNDLLYWGYFKGEINGKKVTLENVKDETLHPITSMGTNIRDFDEPADSIRWMITGINLSEETTIIVTLFHLNKGVRYVTRWAKGDWNQDGIHIKMKDPNSKEYDNNTYYIPEIAKPFRVEIKNSTYEDRWHPIIEVKLDGVLYNSKNLNDSIIVTGTYGTRVN